MELEDCTCKICMCILIEPVRMPCGHEICLKCFNSTVQQANLECPMCRRRIATWSRRASREKTLVDAKRWQEIQAAFPKKVRQQLEGLEESSEEFFPESAEIRRDLSKPGEIREEYEAELKRVHEQLVEQQRQENEASERLIEQLQREEDVIKGSQLMDLEKAYLLDQKLARSLAETDTSLTNTPEQPNLPTFSGKEPVSLKKPTSNPTLESYLNRIRKGDDARKEYNDPIACSSTSDPRKDYPYPIACTSTSDDPLLSQTVSARNSRCSSINVKAVETVNPDLGKFSVTPVLERSEIFPDATLSQSVFKNSLPSTPVKCSLKGEQSASLGGCIMSKSQGYVETQKHSDFPTLSPAPETSKKVDKSETVMSSSSLVTCSDSSSDSLVDTKDDSVSEETKLVSRVKRSNSVDSIDQELSHFRPIQSCPKTPPRRLPGGRVVETKIIKCTPRNTVPKSENTERDILSPDSNLGSPIMQRRLEELVEERKQHVVELSKSTSTLNSDVKHEKPNAKKLQLKREKQGGKIRESNIFDILSSDDGYAEISPDALKSSEKYKISSIKSSEKDKIASIKSSDKDKIASVKSSAKDIIASDLFGISSNKRKLFNTDTNDEQKCNVLSKQGQKHSGVSLKDGPKSGVLLNDGQKCGNVMLELQEDDSCDRSIADSVSPNGNLDRPLDYQISYPPKTSNTAYLSPFKNVKSHTITSAEIIDKVSSKYLYNSVANNEFDSDSDDFEEPVLSQKPVKNSQAKEKPPCKNSTPARQTRKRKISSQENTTKDAQYSSKKLRSLPRRNKCLTDSTVENVMEKSKVSPAQRKKCRSAPIVAQGQGRDDSANRQKLFSSAMQLASEHTVNEPMDKSHLNVTQSSGRPQRGRPGRKPKHTDVEKSDLKFAMELQKKLEMMDRYHIIEREYSLRRKHKTS